MQPCQSDNFIAYFSLSDDDRQDNAVITSVREHNSLGTRRDRLRQRNLTMTARYYYWSELKRRRFDDVIRLLADSEFFLDDRTVTNILLENDEFYNNLVHLSMDCKSLKEMFPSWDWSI